MVFFGKIDIYIYPRSRWLPAGRSRTTRNHENLGGDMRLAVTAVFTLFLSACMPLAGQDPAVELDMYNLDYTVTGEVDAGRNVSFVEKYFFPAKVKNQSRQTVTVRMHAERPSGRKLKEGWSKIPDADWITFEPETFVLEDLALQEVDIRLYIPNQAKYRGQKYQVKIVAKEYKEPIFFGVQPPGERAEVSGHLMIPVSGRVLPDLPTPTPTTVPTPIPSPTPVVTPEPVMDEKATPAETPAAGANDADDAAEPADENDKTESQTERGE